MTDPTTTVLGPYREKDRSGFKLVIKEGGKTKTKRFSTEREALDWLSENKPEQALSKNSLAAHLDSYEMYMVRIKDNRPRSVAEATAAIMRLLGCVDEQGNTSREAAMLFDIRKVDLRFVERRVVERSKTVCKATLEKELMVTKRFLKRIDRLPAGIEKIELAGRKNAGSKQLSFDETVKLFHHCLRKPVDHEGATLVLTAILHATIGRELLDRRVSDLDRQQTALVIREGKTRNREKTILLHELLIPRYQYQARGAHPNDYLFPSTTGGAHFNDWLRKELHRLCDEAGVSHVSMRGLRGTSASRLAETGQSAITVAEHLRHGKSAAVAKRHYIAPGSLNTGHAQSMVERLSPAPAPAPAPARPRLTLVPRPSPSPSTPSLAEQLEQAEQAEQASQAPSLADMLADLERLA